MKDGWWKMRPATLGIIRAAIQGSRKDALWMRLLVPMCSMVRDGDCAKEKDQEAVRKWLDERGLEGIDLDDIQTIGLSVRDTEKLLGLDLKAATRAIQGLQQVGLLTLVRKGTRGQASLFIVNPLPSPSEDG